MHADDGLSPARQLVHDAGTDGELMKGYAAWSPDYDRETAAQGYALPFVATAWMARYVPAGTGPILDAGCGTGLSGPYLAALGYRGIVGADLSPDMLLVAATRGVYAELAPAAMGGGPLPWPDGHFAASFCAGVFTGGHAPASSLDELARVTRRGGHAVFTVRDRTLKREGFADRIDAISEAGRWRLLEKSPAFRSFTIGKQHIFVHAFVFEVN